MKVQELIAFINEGRFPSLWEADEAIDEKFGRQTKVLRRAQRYSIATDVYQCEDGYVGVTGCPQLISEVLQLLDANVITYAEEFTV